MTTNTSLNLGSSTIRNTEIFAKTILSSQPDYVDPYGLIKEAHKEFEQSNYSWFLNLALLKNALKESSDTKTTNIVNFLINSYLDKCSSSGYSTAKQVIGLDVFNEDYQINPYNSTSYYRTAFLEPRFTDTDSAFGKQLAASDQSPLILTETDQIADFVALYFQSVNATDQNWTEEFCKTLQKWISRFQADNPGLLNEFKKTAQTPTISVRLISNASSLPIPSSVQGIFRNLSPTPAPLIPSGMRRIYQTTPQKQDSQQATDSENRPSTTCQTNLRSEPLLTQLPVNIQSFYTSNIYLVNPPKRLHVLIDFTAFLGPYIKTYGRPEQETLFLDKLKEVQTKLDQAIKKELLAFFPDKNEQHSTILKLEELLKKSISSIVRINFETENGEKIGGLKCLPLFTDSIDKKHLYETHGQLVAMIQYTGLALGPVKRRKFVSQDYLLGNDIKYDVSGPNIKFFESVHDFVNLSLLKRMAIKLDALSTHQPHMTVLGKATLGVLSELLRRWSSLEWESWNRDPALRMIIQTTLYKIKELLANGELSIHDNNYARFALINELIHCELTALLEISSPFKTGYFSKIYKEKLIQHNILPKDLVNMTKTGLSRNAMNTFVGLIIAIRKNTPSPICGRGLGIYFETNPFIRMKIEDLLNSKDTPKVHLYATQTNPSINSDHLNTHYKEDPIAENIKELLLLNAKTNTPLTVSIDCTIENFDSDKLRNIFRTFEEEVKSGNLTFFIYSSGQKFDMFGQDNYYGSPYYLIKNGESKWDFLNQFLSEEVFQPDSLSYQWFCLVYQDPLIIDQYRNLVFQNTLEILKQIPENLKYDANSNLPDQLFVSEFDNNVQPSFIDIKLKGSDHIANSIQLIKKFQNICGKYRIKNFQRLSFGFNHHNISRIVSAGNSSTVRITPGLNPHETFIIIEFLDELSSNIALKNKKLELTASSVIDLSGISILPSQVLEANNFRGELYSPMPHLVVDKIKGNSWKEACPVKLDDLAYLRVNHYDLKGQIALGEIIFHKNLASELLLIFQELFEAKYPIDKMLLVDNYETNDNLSMKDNNSYAFCYRTVTGDSTSLSRHSFGCSIDLNPVINPYIKEGSVYPKEGEQYLDRSKPLPGLIQRNDACHSIFTKHGYWWGGDWQNKDYHHFEKIGSDFLTKKT